MQINKTGIDRRVQCLSVCRINSISFHHPFSFLSFKKTEQDKKCYFSASNTLQWRSFLYLILIMMTKHRTFLLLTILFTLLFIVLITIGSYLLSIQSKQFAVASFLFAFGAVFGQITCLALFLREHARRKARQHPSQQENKHV